MIHSDEKSVVDRGGQNGRVDCLRGDGWDKVDDGGSGRSDEWYWVDDGRRKFFEWDWTWLESLSL